MSKELEKFTDELVEETLAEAADSFFGMRRRLEEEKDLYREKLDYLRDVRAKALERAATLQHLLLGRRAAFALYELLEIEPGPLLDSGAEPISGRQRQRLLPRPMALTRAGVYLKLVTKAFDALQDRVDEYLNGRFYADPHGSGKKLSNPYHRQMAFWCRELNERISRANANIPPSQTRRLVKALHPGLADKERIMDAPLDGFDQSYDQSLSLPPADCGPLEELALPELPPVLAAGEALATVCRSVWDERRREVQDLLDSW